MRVFTPGMKVIDGLCGTRVCLLLVFVFACFSSSVTAASNILVPLRHPSNLASQQRGSSVTIVFKNIDTKNRIAVDFARRKVHRKILDYLKRKKSTAASTFWTTAAPSTSFVSTTVTTVSTHDITSTTTTTSTTPSTTTTAATTITATTTVNPTTSSTPTTPSTTTTSTPSTTSTTTTLPSTSTTTTAALTTTPTSTIAQPPPTHGEPDKERRRKRRNSGGNNDKLTDDDLSFIRNNDELSENGNFVISIFIHKEGFGDLDLSELLHEAANELIKPGPIQGSAFSPQMPVSIYRGLPKELSPVETPQLSLNFWLLILAISALLLVFIFIFISVRYWSSRNKKMGGTLA